MGKTVYIRRSAWGLLKRKFLILGLTCSDFWSRGGAVWASEGCKNKELVGSERRGFGRARPRLGLPVESETLFILVPPTCESFNRQWEGRDIFSLALCDNWHTWELKSRLKTYL